ncbi:hypothetical protein A2866_03615 [Candidatus Roizmanbacteria bacterium RIFCSPHIGHO2_01_FULL_39_8]|uniref:UDP-N-acetylglucosamine--N-acetylmuramyl-(pentapeptide) pyrophosphoryl-undecaprenol N-acetylglucosamine transferase n=3 Tax=Candidatus Roizmaniibacteriota TaxID=1752723 RepID=A0A1F7GLK0_9BACT|nr:MAG: hypothetical protein A2866_03615 [Candidatus Roizmanbacteria bacterium RIFCSPHIGHO2_01_FULL_39_8]OGK27106.1 MAG: hypothetical protein A3C28_04960 [Candidatus Roizmanbacteria bacterium RIFCSPHIGHO2_02_FULL_39_9]OGK35838.1 MAG: hypothetical protein A3F60_00130 [Candidatus Roizmanbacteria bacterium RIFCSPHIGHO2_12_FULL_39_8]
MKILVTGGHITPALAVIDELKNNHSLFFVGRKYALDTESKPSFEYQVIQKRKISFYHLQAGRLTRILSFRSFINFIKVPLGFFNAYKIIRETKPDIILSFGGYIGFPVSLVGYIMSIPIYIHEQTIHPGIANRITGRIAAKIFISFPETIHFFPQKKTIITGNPVRQDVLRIIEKPFQIIKKRPILYITGGSLGSHSINSHIETILPQLLKKYTVIHQTGNVEEYNDYERLKKKVSLLPKDLQENYYIAPHISEQELGFVLSISDLVISRAGANTVFELIAWKIPAVLIPLPWSSYQEQQKHALLFQSAGVAEIFDQRNNSLQLLDLIQTILGDSQKYKNNFKKLTNLFHKDAASIIKKTLENSQ